MLWLSGGDSGGSGSGSAAIVGRCRDCPIGTKIAGVEGIVLATLALAFSFRYSFRNAPLGVFAVAFIAFALALALLFCRDRNRRTRGPPGLVDSDAEMGSRG